MKKYSSILFGIAAVFYLLFLAPAVYAHFPKTDKAITVELHVDPNDSPVPLQPANLYFLFDDTTKQFSLSTCHCAVSITEKGKQIFSQILVATDDAKPSVWGAHIAYSFPKRDAYVITITGVPVSPHVFQPFTLSWNFRVANYPIQQESFIGQIKQILTYIILGIGAGGLIFGGMWLFFFLQGKKQRQK